MRARDHGLVLGMLLASLTWTAAVRADGMRLALSRLSRGNCVATVGEGTVRLRDGAGAAALQPDEDAFHQLARELSSAIALPVLEPVITSGSRGFDVALDTTLADIDQHADAWRRGTAGSGPATCDGENGDVRPLLIGNRLRFSKGLPLGLSLAATIGRLHDVGLVLVGVALKVALLEEALGGRLPDLALRGALTRAVGPGALVLYATTIDALISKRWVVGGQVAISPFVGGGLAFTRASSDTVDLTPNIDALACRSGVDPVCNAGGVGASDADLPHDVRFTTVSLFRPRAFLGVALSHRMMALSASATLDVGRAPTTGTPHRPWVVGIAPSVSF